MLSQLPSSIQLRATLCVCVLGAWGGVVELRGIPRGRVLVLEFLLHKLSFEWLSVTLALLKCSLLSSFLFPKALHRPAQILVHVLPRSHQQVACPGTACVYSVHPSEETAIKLHHSRLPRHHSHAILYRFWKLKWFGAPSVFILLSIFNISGQRESEYL